MVALQHSCPLSNVIHWTFNPVLARSCKKLTHHAVCLIYPNPDCWTIRIKLCHHLKEESHWRMAGKTSLIGMLLKIWQQYFHHGVMPVRKKTLESERVERKFTSVPIPLWLLIWKRNIHKHGHFPLIYVLPFPIWGKALDLLSIMQHISKFSAPCINEFLRFLLDPKEQLMEFSTQSAQKVFQNYSWIWDPHDRV